MVRAVRGMRDLLPGEGALWDKISAQIAAIFTAYSYDPIALPLVEFTELFARGVGEATDIVEKEMYTLADRDGESLALRPEGTAGCVRALQEHGLLYNQTQRVSYAGPMFRYEKPQKGRYRQFYQIGAEAFGFAGPDIDAELIALGYSCWRQLGINDLVTLQINSLGSSESRASYRKALLTFLSPHESALDEDSQRRLKTNPLRILDSKDPTTQKIVADAPKMIDFVDTQSREHFEGLQLLLRELQIPFQVNDKLVRGLDYYTHTVFEWVTESLGSQGAVCAGGRYDGLVEVLGGRAMPAAGFAIGLDRVVLLHQLAHADASTEALADVAIYVCFPAEGQAGQALQTAAWLRDRLPGLRIRTNAGGGNLGKQLKRADKCGATWAVIVEEQAGVVLSEGFRVSLKHLRDRDFGQAEYTLGEATQQMRDSD